MSIGRSEVAINSIGRRVERSNCITDTLDGRLEAMQQILSRTHQAVTTQSTYIDRFMESVSSIRPDSVFTGEGLPKNPTCRNRHCVADALEDECEERMATDPPIWSRQRHARRGTTQSYRKITSQLRRTHDQAIAPAPTTLIDSSSNFFPETYTVDQRLPASYLLVTGSYEQMFSLGYKTNVYRVLFRKDPRQWYRLDVSIDLPRSSSYWAATKLTPEEFKTYDQIHGAPRSSLPLTLLTKLQRCLEQVELVEADTSIHFSLSWQDDVMLESKRIDSGQLVSSPQHLFVDALAFLDDLGCPRYYQQDVIQIKLLEPPNRFVSCLSGRIVLETMFARTIPSVSLLYSINVLHCVRGHLAFANLVGVVTNKKRTRLMSYLIDFPVSQFRIQEKMGDPGITWQRREKWARQLVVGVAEVHKKGYVVGTLLHSRGPLIMEESDCVHFCRFRQTHLVGRKHGGYYPPEFGHLKSYSPSTAEADCPRSTSKTDIYQLGQLLWILAENKPGNFRSPVCIRKQCGNRVDHEEQRHFDCISLPPLPETIPGYYREMVNACRSKHLEDRPSARDLLDRFPRLDTPLFSPPKVATFKDTISGRMGKVYRCTFACDLCGESELSWFLHCNVCNLNSFEICYRRYTAGRHCYQEDHLLIEMKEIGDRQVPRRYYSKVQSSGYRDVFEL